MSVEVFPVEANRAGLPIFNLLSRIHLNVPNYPCSGPKEYYEDIEVPYSSLLTQENLERLSTAYTDGIAEFIAEAHEGTIHIDKWVERFQERIGPELLEELRIGQEVLTGVYDADLRNTFYNPLLEAHGLLQSVLYSVEVSDYYHPPRNAFRQLHSSFDDMSPGNRFKRKLLACVFANVAVITRSLPNMSPSAAHMFALLLARVPNNDDEPDLYKALAACITTHMERLALLSTTWPGDFGESVDIADFLLHDVERAPTLVYDPDVVSLNGSNNFNPSGNFHVLTTFTQLATLAIADRLVRREPAENVDMENIFRPCLVDANPGENRIEQTRTELFPRYATSFQLNKAGTKIPALIGKSDMGMPALLLPADMRCTRFLANLYGVKLPTEVDPLMKEGDLLWSSLFDPMMFVYAMKSIGIMIYHSWEEGENFSEASNTVIDPVVTGRNDLAHYLSGVGETGLFVNEIIIQGCKGGVPW